jgi:drug/metabolite transporter (DMT)-like permease
MRLILSHPARAAVGGAIAIAFSGILYKAAHVSPSTGAFFRCAYALPALWLLVRFEERILGPRPREFRRWAWLAGAFFAADLLLWHHAIEAVGAGLATVLGNTQVVMVGLLAWALFSERPSNRALAAIPIAMVGVVLISGVLEDGAYGENPALGVVLGLLTDVAYSGFLLALRHGAGERRRVAGPQAWLITLALSAQVVGWLLITVSLPRLPAVVTSVLLTLQPVATVVLAAILIDENPSVLQLFGAATILCGLLVATIGRRAAAPEPVPERA